MNNCDAGIRASGLAGYKQTLILAMLALFTLNRGVAQPKLPPASSAPVERPQLSTEQVVQRLVAANLKRAQALHGYEVNEVCSAKYRGFGGALYAQMSVDMKYESPATKQFTIESATGSKLVINRVFRRLLRAQKQATGPEVRKHAALNSDNYNFSADGFETIASGPAYVLRVTPKRKDKFLYQGKIWVNVLDFAVTRVEAKPAKSPSFWVRDSQIEEQYTKMGEFWLPAYVHSTSSIRFGGQAELTIEYKNYQFTSTDTVGDLTSAGR